MPGGPCRLRLTPTPEPNPIPSSAPQDIEAGAKRSASTQALNELAKARSRNASALGLADMGQAAALGPAVARAFASNGDSAASTSPDDSPKRPRASSPNGSTVNGALPGASALSSSAMADTSARRWAGRPWARPPG